MKAVMWTDVFQTIVMFVGLLASVIQGRDHFDFVLEVKGLS